MLGGVDPCWLCQGAIVGADYGIEFGPGWVHVRCIREPELEKLRRWLKSVRACAVAIEAEGLWLARVRLGTPYDAEQMGKQWAQRRADLEALLFDRLGEFTGH